MYQHPRTLTKSGENTFLRNRVQFIKALFELEKQRCFSIFFALIFRPSHEYQKKNVYSHT